MLRDVEPALMRQYQSHITEHGYNLKKELTGANLNSAYGIRDGRFKVKSKEQKQRISIATKEGMSDSNVRELISQGVKEFYATGGVHSMLGKKHRSESIAQMSARHLLMSDETKRKIGERSKKMWSNLEERARVLVHIQNPTVETRHKMSAAKKGKASWNKGKANTWTATHRSKTYLVTVPNGEILEVTNLRAFAKERGLSQGTLHMTATGQRIAHKGYQARFK